MKNYKLHALTSAFASYLIDQLGDSIKGIYLFGSVARGEATKESDIDIFVDTSISQEAVSKAVDNFETTTAAKTYRVAGIKNTLNALAGNLDSEEFSDLRLSMAADGIVLYGKGLPTERKGKLPHLLVWFETPKQQKKKVAFLREIYGRKEKGKEYSAMLDAMGGFKAGANTVVIPLREKAAILEHLKKAKVKYTVKNVWL